MNIKITPKTTRITKYNSNGTIFYIRLINKKNSINEMTQEYLDCNLNKVSGWERFNLDTLTMKKDTEQEIIYSIYNK
jgi:hypothetical protein